MAKPYVDLSDFVKEQAKINDIVKSLKGMSTKEPRTAALFIQTLAQKLAPSRSGKLKSKILRRKIKKGYVVSVERFGGDSMVSPQSKRAKQVKARYGSKGFPVHAWADMRKGVLGTRARVTFDQTNHSGRAGFFTYAIKQGRMKYGKGARKTLQDKLAVKIS
jgi:hypothetical protein